MPLFAEIGNEWVTLIITLLIVVGKFIDYRIAKGVKDKVAEASVASAVTAAEQSGKFSKLAHEMNSLKDELVASVKAEALARGGVEERQRADDREDQKRNSE